MLVRRDDAKVVNLQRGTERQTFNCTPQCNPLIVIGDHQKYFEMISKADRADHVGHVHWMVELSQAITIGRRVTQVTTPPPTSCGPKSRFRTPKSATS